eukprot:999320-Prymnesium_polylepis.1
MVLLVHKRVGLRVAVVVLDGVLAGLAMVLIHNASVPRLARIARPAYLEAASDIALVVFGLVSRDSCSR